MCGIAGIFDINNLAQQVTVDNMVDVLTHSEPYEREPYEREPYERELDERGPDERGTFLDGHFGFGMRRLGIPGLSTGFHSIFNEDRSKVIVFDGKIYNYQELCNELRAKGHRFKTSGDAETILHLFEEHGPDCLSYLRGMFAFAIWDITKQELFIARDRFGIKPLYYFWDGSTFIFSSELKSLLTQPLCSKRLDPKGVSQFFTFLYVPHERTLFYDIKKLLPGHFLHLRSDGLEIKRYYKLPMPIETKLCSDDEWVEYFLEEAKDTIRAHLVGDVPVGAFLSGGIDSSIVVALMSKLLENPVQAFAIGYDHQGASFDERIYARKVADLYGAKLHQLVVTPEMAASSIPLLLERLGEPFGNASVIPNYFLSEYTSGSVKAALSGLGGDEVCAGYERYLGTLLAERAGPLRFLAGNRLFRALAAQLPDSEEGYHFPERIKRFLESAALPLQDRYNRFSSRFSEQEHAALLKREFLSADTDASIYSVLDCYWEDSAHLSPLQRLMKVDLGTYLTDDLLALSDRSSMAHGLEVRVPFVDHKLVEFFWAVPDRLKIRGLTKKYLLKKAAERLLPKDIIYRRKQGFSLPLSVWFRGSLKNYLLDTLSRDNIEALGIFNADEVEKIISEHLSMKRNHDEKIYAVLSFVVWHQTKR